MTLPLLGLVRLTTDRYAERGIRSGAIGTIVLLHDGAYEVEFSRPDGTTIALFAVLPEELELVEEAPVEESLRHSG